jgi:hypothetical protein
VSKTRARPRSPTTRALTADRARARIGPDVARLERVPRGPPGWTRNEARAPRGPRLAAATAAAHLPIGWLLLWLDASNVEPESEMEGLGVLVIAYGLISISIWVAALVVGLWRHREWASAAAVVTFVVIAAGSAIALVGRIRIPTPSYGAGWPLRYLIGPVVLGSIAVVWLLVQGQRDPRRMA